MTDMINIGAMVDSWRATPGAIIHPKLSNAVDAARAAFKANKMTDITDRLRRLYVQDGTNYVQEAANAIEQLRAERDALVNNVHSCHAGCQKAGCVNQRLRDALREYIAASDIILMGDDDVAAVLRFGEAEKAARAALGETKEEDE